MKLVFIQNDRPITDSLIVAETFGKRHADVLRSIDNLECSREFYERNFASVEYKDSKGEVRRKVDMTQDGFSFLVMGYTGREAARFKEMYIGEFNRMRDELSKPKLPQTKIEALEAYLLEMKRSAALEEEVKQKDEVLTLQAPKVALYDTAMNAGNNHTMERVSKTLGYGRNKLFAFLREIKVLRENNLPYQRFIDQGYFTVRQYSITHLTQGIENKTQTLVTPKGMAYIHKLLLEHGKIPTTLQLVVSEKTAQTTN